MCGIIGAWGLSDQDLARKMNEAIRHRGPDEDGFYFDKDVMLANRRLKIIDLSPRGRQPIFNEDQTVCVVFNGEIYNYKALRAELEKKGHRFASETDTEVLVHAYESWGNDFMARLRGMFAFALWDSKRKRLVLARDHAGRKPLYYAWHDGVLYFASEIKALVQSNAVPAQVDPQGVVDFLAYQFVPGRATTFAGISKLLPGEYLILDQGKPTLGRYWNVEERITPVSESEAVARLDALFSKLGREKSVAEVPVGSFLSGGLDSTLLVSYLKPHIPYTLHTFSVGFGENSELPFARMASEVLDTEHHAWDITPQDSFGLMDTMAWNYDEPVGDPATLAFLSLSELARKHVTVSFSGQGADELFAEKSEYALATSKEGRQWSIASFVPFKPLWGALSKLHPHKTDPRQNKPARMFRFLSQENREQAFVYWAMRTMDDAELRHLTRNDQASRDSVEMPPRSMHDRLTRLQYVSLKNTLAEKFLMVADKASMAVSLEGRTFFLDPMVVEFAFSVPAALKINDGQGKYLLKKLALRQGIPKELVYRQKRGFSFPLYEWLYTDADWKSHVENTIEQSQILKELCKPAALDEYIEKTRLDKSDFKRFPKGGHPATVRWNLYALARWHSAYEAYFS